MPNLNQVVRTEFAAAISQIASERKIPEESIYEAIRQALVSAYRKQIGDLDITFYYYVDLNRETGESKIFRAPILEKDELTQEITKWDESKAEDVTPAGFGRIAAQTAKQVILQKIRQSEKDQIISDYRDRVGELLTAQVLRMSGKNVIMDIGRGQGIMPPEEQMRGEFYRPNQRLAVLVKEIRDSFKGEIIVVTRADAKLVEELFKREVPEVSSGAVEIVGTAREAGVRTKIAVRSTQDGVDPVGSCVGQRGVRVQKVIEELNNEKIDIIPYHDEIKTYLQASLAPAESLQIEIDDDRKTSIVTAPDDQLSLAIGKGGQNVRLAAKLTGYRITIKSATGDVKLEATGKEQYEIDTINDLTEETREFLIENKLTTYSDLIHFDKKWIDTDQLEANQLQLIKDKVEVYKQSADYQEEQKKD